MHGWCTTPPPRAPRDAGTTSPAESEGGQLFMKLAIPAVVILVLMGGKL